MTAFGVLHNSITGPIECQLWGYSAENPVISEDLRSGWRELSPGFTGLLWPELGSGPVLLVF